MRPYLRCFRIGWTILCGIAAVLLCVLWVRSYGQADVVAIRNVGNLVASMRGDIYLGGVTGFRPSMTNEMRDYRLTERWTLICRDIEPATTPSGYNVFVVGNSVAVPYLIATPIVAGLATLPWLRWRFSLRTLLIATTLVAVVLGLVVWAMR